MENPTWVLFARLQAEQAAKAGEVGMKEAYEGLRRKYMLIYQAEQAEPIYWMFAKE